MKKRVTSVLLIAVISIMLIAGCGSKAKYADSKYLGKWSATTAEYMGMSLQVSSILGDFTIELTEDGKCTLTIANEKKTGSWEETKEGFKIVDGKDELAFKGDDKKVVVDYEGMTLNFEKK